MGITRNQLRRLGFKGTKELKYTVSTSEETKTLTLPKNEKVIYYTRIKAGLISRPVVHLDDTGYFEMQKALQDISIGLDCEFKNQL